MSRGVAGSVMWPVTSPGPGDPDDGSTAAYSPGSELSPVECLSVAELSRAYRRTMLLVLVFMALLMAAGTAGNLLVTVVYALKPNKATANYFMLALAASDLLSSALLHPYVIFKLLHFYSAAHLALCKLFEFLIHASMAVQLLLLMAVAVDRYYAVCRPLSFVHARNRAWGLILVSLAAGTTGSLPLLVFYGRRTMAVAGEGGCVTMVSTCHYSDEWDGSMSQGIYGAVTILLMLGLLTVIGVLYVKVARTVYRRSRQVTPGLQQIHRPHAHTHTGTGVCPPPVASAPRERRGQAIRLHVSGLVDTGEGSEAVSTANNATPVSPVNTVSTSPEPGPSHAAGARGHGTTWGQAYPPRQDWSRRGVGSLAGEGSVVHGVAGGRRKNRADSSIKAAKLLFMVTAIFVLSWLPFWVLKIGAIVDADSWGQHSASLLHSLCNHMYFLNNAVNPVIYVFVNSNFRTDCRAVLGRWG